ncbi:MAG: hypothetical protein OXU50_07425 [Gammaproteobacteria bacterium]|nr:hypothetical protein [Gammaproteobacteria bacterium]
MEGETANDAVGGAGGAAWPDFNLMQKTKKCTVRRVFNTAHSNTYTFLHCQMPKRLPKEVASHGKIYKTAGRSGQGFDSPREPRGGIAFCSIVLGNEQVVWSCCEYNLADWLLHRRHGVNEHELQKENKMSFYEKAGAIIGLVMLALGIFLHYKYGRD